jgi:hypothetical protein
MSVFQSDANFVSIKFMQGNLSLDCELCCTTGYYYFTRLDYFNVLRFLAFTV